METNKHINLCCYKCGTRKQLLVKEWTEKGTGIVVRKEFICAPCADLFISEEE